jgi:hypothetical protein
MTSLDKIRAEIAKLEGSQLPAISLKLPPTYSGSCYASVELSPIPKRRTEAARESINSMIAKLTSDPLHFSHDPVLSKILTAQTPSSPQFKLQELTMMTPQTPSYSEVSVSEFFSKMMVQAETLTPRH